MEEGIEEDIDLTGKQLWVLMECETWLNGFDRNQEVLVLGEKWEMWAYVKQVSIILKRRWYYQNEKEFLNELRYRWIKGTLDYHLVMSI